MHLVTVSSRPVKSKVIIVGNNDHGTLVEVFSHQIEVCFLVWLDEEKSSIKRINHLGGPRVILIYTSNEFVPSP